MSFEDCTSLKVDIEARSAKLLMFYFSVTFDLGDDANEMARIVGDIKNVVVSRDGNIVTAYMWFDYGKMIPESIWTMFGRDSLMGIMGDDPICEQMTNEAILESVKILYPRAVGMLRESAEKLEFGKGQEEK